MRLTRLVVGVLLMAAVLSLVRAIVTRDGVGAAEYAVSLLVLLALVFFAVSAFRGVRRA